jgi:DNA-binding NtrC family response regulator
MNPTLRLFLVEDDDDVGFLMRKSLERAGHHVTVCHSGTDALQVLHNAKFDLVLLDQRLPDISGIEILETLNREGISTPVLMVTQFGHEELASQVLRAGRSTTSSRIGPSPSWPSCRSASRNRRCASSCSRRTGCSSHPSNRRTTAS